MANKKTGSLNSTQAASGSNSRRSAPVLMLAIALLALAGLVEIARIYLYEDTSGNLAIKKHAGTPETFRTASPRMRDAIYEKKEKEHVGKITKPPFHDKPWGTPQVPVNLSRAMVPVYNHNPAQGPAGAPLTLTIFNDIRCGSCRVLVNEVVASLNPYSSKLRVVYKFFPAKSDNDNDGGIFQQVAMRSNVFNAFNDLVMESEGELGTEDYVKILEQSGVSLSKQRVLMARDMNRILRNIQTDISQGHKLNLSISPTFFLNGYRIGGIDGLPVENLSHYADRILSRRHPLNG